MKFFGFAVALLASVLLTTPQAFAEEPDPYAQRECFQSETSANQLPNEIEETPIGNLIGIFSERDDAVRQAREFGLCVAEYSIRYFIEPHQEKQIRIISNEFSVWEPRALLCMATQGDPSCSVPLLRSYAHRLWVQVKDAPRPLIIDGFSHPTSYPYIVPESDEDFERFRQRSDSN
jgi:hypothetical protein